MNRAAFLPWPVPTVTVRSAGTMSPPANNPGQPVIIDADTTTVPSALELHARHLAQEAGVRVLAHGQDQRVGGQRFQLPGRPREARLVEFHDLDGHLRPVERGDRVQPADPHAFPLGLPGLFVVGGHLGPGTPVDDQCVVRAEAARGPGGVHRGVAAAVHGDPAADHRMPARRDLAQERHGLHDPARVPGRDVHVLGQVRADRDEHRVEAAVAPLGGQVGDPMPAGDGHPEGLDPADLRGDYFAGQPVGGNPVAHHPTGLGAGVPDLHLMTQPGQVVGGRQTAGPGPDDQHALTGRGGRGIECPALLQGQVAEEPLDRMDGNRAIQLRAVADAFTRVVADPAVDGRQRVVRHQLPPRPLRPPRLDVG